MSDKVNMAEAYPAGIRLLSEQSVLQVFQKSGFKNKYMVRTPGGQELLYAKENSSTLNAIFGGRNRSFSILDTDEREVITLRRPLTFGPNKMDVSVCGQLVSVVRQESTWLKPVLNVNDASDRPVLRIKGPIGRSGECDFDVFTMDKRKIGVIRKNYRGLLREMFTNSDNFCIEFPQDLDVRFKAALLSACFLIDFLYYEK